MPVNSLFDPDPDTSDEEVLDDGDGEVSFEDDHPEPALEDDPKEELPDEDPDVDAEDPPDEDPDEDEQTDEDQIQEQPESDRDEVDAQSVADVIAEVAGLPTERREPVRLSDLQLDYKFWENPRKFSGLATDELQLLADDILSRSFSTEQGFIAGIQEPLLVVRVKDEDGGIVQLVLDGQRRYRALEMALAATKAKGGAIDLKDVWVKVRDREPEPVEWSQELALQYLAEVLGVVGQRQGLSGYELSMSASKLRGTRNPDTDKEYTIAQIATKIGRSPSWVSKIFTALDSATPKLLEQWRSGKIPEETFRSLASGYADHAQANIAAEIADKRKGGDKGEARRAALEAAEIAKQQKKTQKEAEKRAREQAEAAKEQAKKDAQAAKAKAKKGEKDTVVRGPQADLPIKPEQPAPKPDTLNKPSGESKPTKPKPIPFAVIEDWVEQSKKHPPTHDLVKGIVLGLQAATGLVDMANLPKPWHTYVHHLSGVKPDKKPTKRTRKK